MEFKSKACNMFVTAGTKFLDKEIKILPNRNNNVHIIAERTNN